MLSVLKENMKLSAAQLRRIIMEEVSLAKGGDATRFLHGSESGQPFDDEAYMVKIQMDAIKKMAEEVCEMLKSGDQLPAWLQSHVAVAHENLRQAHGYLVGDAAVDAKMQESKRSKKNLVEAHKRITQEEIAAWKSGNWGFISEDDDDEIFSR